MCSPAAMCRAGTVVSEQYLLDLEREAFLSLCGEPKTQQRMQHMLAREAAAQLDIRRRYEEGCNMREAVIVAAVRTAVGKAKRGSLRRTRAGGSGQSRAGKR